MAPASDTAEHDPVAYTLYATCTGTAILAVEAGPEIAELAAARLGYDLSSRCGQCGDLNYAEITIATSEVNGANLGECTVITAAQLDELLADEETNPT